MNINFKNKPTEKLLPLVFLHGWGSDSRIWTQLQTHFSDWECINWDLPGFGENRQVDATLDSFLEQSAEHLPQQCVLVGWSLGGMVAASLAARAPARVKALITIASNATFVDRPAWDEAMPRAIFQNFVKSFESHPQKTFKRFCMLQVQGESSKKNIVSQLEIFSTNVTGRWRAGLDWLGTLDNRHLLAKLAIPQLSIFGSGDALVPVSAAAKIAQFPQVTSEVLQGGHCLPLTHSNLCAESMKQFLSTAIKPPIEKQKIANSFASAAPTYDQFAQIQKTVGRTLLKYLPAKCNGHWLDLGAGTGFLLEVLEPMARPQFWLNGDIAHAMLQGARAKFSTQCAYVTLDAEFLPLADNSLDGIVSSLTIQWCDDLPRLFQEINRVLKPGGRVIANTLVKGTLHELKTAWAEVDNFVHVNRFYSTSSVRDAIVAAGLKQLAFEEVTHTDMHQGVKQVLHSLKTIGAHNMNRGRNGGLTTRAQFAKMFRAYEQFRTEHGVPASYRVLYFEAMKNE